MNEYISKLVQEMIWKPKPLTDAEIIQLYADSGGRGIIDFARAIEERHGIK
jgi:hypothetical protein